MKKIVAFIVVSFLLLSACAVPRDEVLLSLGKYSSKEYFSSGGVQDYTDYAKYTFDSINLEDNQYFEEIDHLNYNDLVVHIDNFEQWIGAIEETLLGAILDTIGITQLDDICLAAAWPSHLIEVITHLPESRP